MEAFIKILIYIHAAFGGLALLSGFVSIIVKKGGTIHKKSGKVFFYTMLLSCVFAMIVAVLPQHQNAFLFSIGIFSLYLIGTGYRALRFKKKNTSLVVDIWISRMMFFSGIAMILVPLFVYKQFNIVLTVFALVGIVLAARDLRLFRNLALLRNKWLTLHISKMIGGYISSVTAFIVVNNFFNSIFAWFVPGIIGGFFIAYWVRKVRK